MGRLQGTGPAWQDAGDAHQRPADPGPRSHPGELDPAMFGGKAMTYYGRWTYKYETAARLGAAARDHHS